uniref:Translation initiation factor IF-2, chloroplastic n=1 Tax=Polysiphonia scopulorum TaxID=257860 RepID=A0A1Z1MIM2_9FLOR|nr:translation initiation factor 2 [Polysiphonia scopulorum]ARW65594.1 translation initiation factor 2 [Polysiphonia scopulorum]
MNIFSHNYNFFPFNVQIFKRLNIYLISEYEDDVLVLINPKLIELNSFSSSQSIESLDIGKNVKTLVNIDTSVSNKFEKKHKPTGNEKNILKGKKQKNRLTKNRRIASENIQNVDILVNDSHDFFNNDSLGSGGIKSRKTSSKNKKKLDLSTQTALSETLQNEDLSQDKQIVVNKPLTISELSSCICIPEAEIITYLFLTKSVSVTINDLLDLEMIKNIADNYGFKVLEQLKVVEKSNFVPSENIIFNSEVTRPPIVTILGHVDHGKTTLLDSILKTNLVKKESGGITQSIVGYEVKWMHDSQEYNIVFLDTPGHESFKSMRVRGAKVTDLVLLVIAVDDGLKPQTIEVINYINEMSLSCIIVATKADKSLSNVSKIKQDLAKYNLITEDLGGDTPFVEVSAISGKNIDLLLSKICIFSKSKNLYADTQKNGFGSIIESYLDKKKGPIANVIIQNGTLKLGHFLVSDNLIGKVKSIFDTSNNRIKFSGPSSVVKVLGFSSVPQAGSLFFSFSTEKDAKKYCKENLNYSSLRNFDYLTKSLNTRITKDTNLKIKNLNIVIKTVNQGSLEAILELFSNMPQSKVQINIVHANFGDISHADVELALATKSNIIAFNVNISSQMVRMLKNFEINFKVFNVVYDLFDYVKDMMLDLIELEYDYMFIGSAIVKTVFKMNKGCVAGCLVDSGKLSKDAYIRVYRNDSIEYQGPITSLKHMKNDVNEVLVSTECGLMSDFESWQISDKIEAYEIVKKDKTL